MSAAPGRSGEKAGEVEGREEKRGRWDQRERPQGRYVVVTVTCYTSLFLGGLRNCSAITFVLSGERKIVTGRGRERGVLLPVKKIAIGREEEITIVRGGILGLEAEVGIVGGEEGFVLSLALDLVPVNVKSPEGVGGRRSLHSLLHHK